MLEEKYLPEGTITPITGDYYDLKIPEGYIFVMGDNRATSRDSREFGVVPLDKVEGIVHIRIWPLNKMKFINWQISTIMLIYCWFKGKTIEI